MDYTKEDSITIDLSGLNEIESGSTTLDLSNIGAAAQTVWFDPNMHTGSLTLDLTTWNSDTITIGDLSNNNTIQVNGENADILINGMSVRDTLRGIQEQLNLLQPNPEMEQEWHELRDLRAQYETKLEECRAKSRMWKALKS